MRGAIPILCLIPLVCDAGWVISNVVANPITYISNRTDGIAGNGTEASPYDATALDTLWASTKDQVKLLSGTYTIGGGLSCSGKIIVGVGNPTIQWTNSGGGGANYAFNDPDSLSGVTIDLGSQLASGTRVPTGIYLGGGCSVSDVVITHLEGYRPSAEGFGILAFGDANTILGVTISNRDGYYMSGIGVGSGTGSVVSNFFIDFDGTDNSPTNWLFGVGVSGYGTLVTDGTVTNATGAIHSDTSGVTPTGDTWSGNTFSNLDLSASTRTIWYDTSTQRYSNYTFVDLTVRAAGHDGYSHYGTACDHWVFLQGTTPTNVAGFTFTNCWFTGSAATNQSENIINNSTGVTNLDMRGNTFDETAVYSEPGNVTTD